MAVGGILSGGRGNVLKDPFAIVDKAPFGDKIGPLIRKGSDPLGLFNKPKGPLPPPPPLPPPVNRNSQAVKDARNKAIREAKNRRGRKSTILTSGRGVSDDQLGVTRPEAKNATTLGG